MNNRGFTLIELMIVVAIIAILGAIAYPSYQSQVRKSNRADAKVAIEKVKLSQNKLRGNCRFYGDEGTSFDCQSTAASTKVQVFDGDSGTTGFQSPERHYTITISNNSSTGYTVQAEAISAIQLKDTNCKFFVVTVSPTNPEGVETSKDSGASASTGCW